MDINHVGDHECIHCGACVDVCPAKAISWKGSKLVLRENDIDSPVPTEKVDLVAMANKAKSAEITDTANKEQNV